MCVPPFGCDCSLRWLRCCARGGDAGLGGDGGVDVRRSAGCVRSALIEALPAGEVAADEIVHRLGVSKRTLQRKLGDEGTTYQKQLNHVRELLAKRYLTTTSMRTDEIAFMLGYVELNSFLRAFSSWTGSTPSEYRKQQQS